MVKKCKICKKNGILIDKNKRELSLCRECFCNNVKTGWRKFRKTPKGERYLKRNSKMCKTKKYRKKVVKGILKTYHGRKRRKSFVESRKNFYKTKEGKTVEKKRVKKVRKFFKSEDGLKYIKKKILYDFDFSVRKSKNLKLNYGKKIFYFRSKNELGVAKYFKEKNIKFFYEGRKNIFYIKKYNCYYVNDFYLTKQKLFVQIDGGFPKKIGSIDKFKQVVEENPDKKFEIWNFQKLKDMGIIKKS